MFRVHYWPPPRGGLTKFVCPWKAFLDLPETSALFAFKHTSAKGAIEHELKMLFAIDESTLIKENAPDIPFTSEPLLYCGTFKGVATNNLEAAKHCLLIQCAEFFWEGARTFPFGSETMIKNAASSIRCMIAAKGLCSPERFPDQTLPPFSHGAFENMIESLCEFAYVQKLRLPPTASVSPELSKATQTLCYCLKLMNQEAPFPTFAKWHRCFVKVLRSWLLFCVGATLIHFKRYPLAAPPEYETIERTATRLSDGIRCLRESQHPSSVKLISDAEEMLDAGYRSNIKAESQYHEYVTGDSFISEHAKGQVFSELRRQADPLTRVLNMFGAVPAYDLT